jgi:hypothetical protein
MSRATDELLDQLHAAQAEGLLSELRKARENGEGISPALFNSITKFLKDNGIDRPKAPKSDLSLLEEELPDFPDMDDMSNVTKGNF